MYNNIFKKNNLKFCKTWKSIYWQNIQKLIEI